MTITAVSPLPNITAISSAVGEGVTVITATQRLARHLVSESAQYRSPVSRFPKILSLEAWLRQEWRQQAETSEPLIRLLVSSEIEALWREVISQYESQTNTFSLLQPEAAAALAARCRASLKDHRIPVASEQVRRAFASESDTACFLKWLDRLDIRLKHEGWVMPEDLPELIANDKRAQDSEVWFLSEEAPVPSVESALSNRFKVVRWFHSASLDDGISTTAYPTRDAEIAAAAKWGFCQHEEGRVSVIVLADYQRDRPLLEHELRELFGSSDQEFTALPVNFSRGIELGKVPMFRDALLLLRLIVQDLDRAEVSALLRSPFFGWPDTERNDKGAVIARLFNSKRRVFELRHLLEALGKVVPNSPLEAALSVARVDRLSSLRLSAWEWRDRISSLLQTAGWPSASGLDSVEYQQLELVDGLFDEIEAYSLDNDPYPLTLFVSRLRSVLSEKLFQPQTDVGKLQVMGLADTTGLSFETIRLVGATSESLPSNPGLLTFIPWEICRSYQISKIDEEAHYTVAARLIGQLSSAGAVSCTYHRVSDGTAKLPSRFCDAGCDEAPTEVREDRDVIVSFESVDDSLGLVTSLPNQQAGGVSLLEQQASCPLKAHLHHKLGIKPLEGEAEGLTPGERGGVLHEALKHLFSSLENSDQIKALTAADREVLIEAAADAASRGLKASVRERVGLSTLDLERQRLNGILATWLDLESKRDTSFTVELSEEPLEWECGGLSLSLKVDRVDRLSTGQRIVIDYKSSGGQTATDWSQSPLKSPQLPCYSQVIANVETIAIGQVSVNEPSYLTLGAEIGLDDADKRSKKAMDRAGVSELSGLKEQWLADLTSLVSAFVEGRATPTPSPSACRYCHYTAICRAHVASDWDANEELPGE
jgi:ATP-dependent helicase/nuclease subunit B